MSLQAPILAQLLLLEFRAAGDQAPCQLLKATETQFFMALGALVTLLLAGSAHVNKQLDRALNQQPQHIPACSSFPAS